MNTNYDKTPEYNSFKGFYMFQVFDTAFQLYNIEKCVTEKVC